MGKLCERPGCSDVAAMAYGFDADRLLVWLALRDPHAEPLRAGSLCTRHADAMVVPQGWTLDDRREPNPRLFRTPPGPATATARRSRAAGGNVTAPSEQLVLRGVADDPSGETAAGSTVAEVAGPTDQPDPDATVAIPWLPDFDDSDDLDGMLAADSPLLARAFRGTDRPR